MRSHTRKILAAGVALALLVGLLGTAVAAGRAPAPKDQPANTVWNVLHWVFRGVRGELRRLGLAVEKLEFAMEKLEGEFIDLDARVDEVEILNQRIEDLEKMVLALQFGVDDLAGLADILPPIEDFNDQLRGCIRIFDGEIGGLPGPHVLFEACNVHVRSGELATDAPVNGRGNLLIGYNEGLCIGEPTECFSDDDCPDPLLCIGAIPEESKVGECRSLGIGCLFDDDCPTGQACDLSAREGSHNLVVGDRHRYSSYAGLVAGQQNLLGGEHASILGGRRNSAIGVHSTVSGGSENTASGFFTSVSGGGGNKAVGQGSSVSGGIDNTAGTLLTPFLLDFASVSGGRNNLAFGQASSVSGGENNQAIRVLSSVCGGLDNRATGIGASVTGGSNNQADGSWSTVSGGQNRTVSGDYDWRAGGAFEDD